MRSLNFEFLRPLRPELAALGGFAEAYAHDDPSSALVKLRTFAEQVTATIYHDLGLSREPSWKLYDLLEQASFTSTIPKVVVDKLHALRVQGNSAAHGGKVHGVTALWLVREAFDLARWFHLTFDGGTPDQLPRKFEEPPPGGLEGLDKLRLTKAKHQALEQLASMEAEMRRLLAELEEARAKAKKTEKTTEDLAMLLALGQREARTLDLDERTTRRRLIDAALLAAGWDVGRDGAATDQVTQEHRVLHQPTPSGAGKADYVLWGDDGRPLAVIEAKETAKDAGAGKTQATYYADGLEKEHGQRPVVFYTNGYETWLWDDAQGDPPRAVAGFYSKDSLEYLVLRRAERRSPVSAVAEEGKIKLRLYQETAVADVLERFEARHRKALVVMATGAGKTRVAVALTQRLIAGRRAKRVLFLCDRRELRKQAKEEFEKFLDEPITLVTRHTADDRNQRIYIATYPAMMKCYESFDVGFFDLVFADESHRSIYKYYRVLFDYFDALQVGLTATPRKGLIDHNTYHMFGCEDSQPTTFFGYDDAIAHIPPYLAHFEVESFTTEFLREGIHYSRMSREQQLQLEENEEAPELIGYDKSEIDRRVFNRDTNRRILENLMAKGLRTHEGTRLGKTIVFARSHDHAVFLETLWNEMYPQYGGRFCRVIDSHDPRAEQLLADFKGEGTNIELTIAISVDMLDTGVDVPEILNLVFAKPTFSYVKFWQMIGRGTRRCENLFGPGQDKEKFLIFDHWGNFEYFEEKYEKSTEVTPRSLLETLFLARLDLARAALDQGDGDAFQAAVDLVLADVRDLPLESVPVRPKWREVRYVERREVIEGFTAETESLLRNEIAPLMQWRVLESLEALRFDLLMAKLMRAKVRGSSRLANHVDEVLAWLAELPVNLRQVRERQEVVVKLRGPRYFEEASVGELEEDRRQLRGIMYLRTVRGFGKAPPRVLDVTEDGAKVESERRVPRLEGLELVEYRRRAEEALRELFDTNPVLRKIHAGEAVSPEDLEALRELVLAQHPDLDIAELEVHYPDLRGHLDVAVRSIIGLDPAKVEERFSSFVRRHPELSARQIRFLDLLQGQIARYGTLSVERLYEPPFTTFHSDGIEGVFEDEEQVVELITLVATFQPPARAKESVD